MLPNAPLLLLTAGTVALLMGPWVRPQWIAGTLFTVLMATGAWLGLDLTRSSELEQDPLWFHDPLALASQCIAWIWGGLFAIGLLGLPQSRTRQPQRLDVLLILMSGVMLAGSARDLLSLVLSLELVQMSVLALRFPPWGGGCDGVPDARWTESRAASLWSGVTISCCLWLGIALILALAGTTQFDELRRVLADAYLGSHRAAAQGSRLGLFGIGLLTVGVTARMGLVPGQTIFLEGQRGLDWWIAGVTLTGGQLAGALAMTRLCGSVWLGYRDELLVLLLAAGMATGFVVAGLLGKGLARGEGQLRRWVAALVQLQSLWWVLGLMSALAELSVPGQGLVDPQQPGAQSVLVFAITGGMVGATGLFLLLATVTHNGKKVDFLEELQGLGRDAPLATASLLLLLASLAGLPLLWGFWSGLMLMLSGLNLRSSSDVEVVAPYQGTLGLTLLCTVVSLLAAAVQLRVCQTVLFDRPLSRSHRVNSRPAFWLSLACGLTLVGVGLAPTSILRWLEPIRSPGPPGTPIEPSGKSRGSATASRSAPGH